MSKYISNVSVDRNDILVNGEKVSGSMMREVLKSSIWAAQITFGDYSEYIEKICQKPAIKKPSRIISTILTRDLLEEEILAWLRKEDVKKEGVE
jgi:lipoate-protein ligase A